MTTKRNPKRAKGEPTTDTLEDIKRLLILQLVTSGVTNRAVASVLGVHESVVSRLVTKSKNRSAK